MNNLPNIPVSQIVTFLTALGPVAAAALGAFDNLPNNVQYALAWAIPAGITVVISVWLWGRARYVVQQKQNELAELATASKRR